MRVRQSIGREITSPAAVYHIFRSVLGKEELIDREKEEEYIGARS